MDDRAQFSVHSVTHPVIKITIKVVLAAQVYAFILFQIYIATFVVSGYASSYYRTGGKPFNPVLGETYECDRPDKGLRFVAEQV